MNTTAAPNAPETPAETCLPNRPEPLTAADRVQNIDQMTKVAEKKTPIARPGMRLHFRLCEYDTPLPLGWVLSEESQGEMQAQLSTELARRLKRDGRERSDRPIARYHDSVLDYAPFAAP